MPNFDTSDILNLTTEDGEVRVDLGDIRTGKGISAESVTWGSDGFISVPNEPDNSTKECARALYFDDGYERIVIGTYDARYAEQVGSLESGDRMIVSKGEQRLLAKQSNESITMYSKNQVTGSSMMVSVHGEDGAILIVNGKSSIQILDDKIVFNVANKSWIEIKEEGVVVGGGSCTLACPKGQIGAPAPGVILPPGAFSILYGVTGMAGVGSLNWTVNA